MTGQSIRIQDGKYDFWNSMVSMTFGTAEYLLYADSVSLHVKHVHQLPSVDRSTAHNFEEYSETLWKIELQADSCAHYGGGVMLVLICFTILTLWGPFAGLSMASTL